MSDPLNAITGVGMNVPQTSSGANGVMGQMDFLQLLMIQLSYQDPMSPMDSQQFASQLAQFSQLEQLTQMNQNMDLSMQTNLILAQSVNNTMAATMIGKQVLAYGDEVELVEGEEAMMHYDLDGAAQNVTISIQDSAGVTVRTIEAGPQASGDQLVSWDGLNDEGEELPAGVYTFSLNATTSQGVAVPATTYISGLISAVSYVDGMAQFQVGEIEIPLSQIYQIIG